MAETMIKAKTPKRLDIPDQGNALGFGLFIP
jgi:hypothetical protein